MTGARASACSSPTRWPAVPQTALRSRTEWPRWRREGGARAHPRSEPDGRSARAPRAVDRGSGCSCRQQTKEQPPLQEASGSAAGTCLMIQVARSESEAQNPQRRDVVERGTRRAQVVYLSSGGPLPPRRSHGHEGQNRTCRQLLREQERFNVRFAHGTWLVWPHRFN